ncbi:MAG: hypothetical protein A2015_06065 [Spirochaetes bacterium GWF1_31_7]|nr:MAG: hypothetical protein A2Y30_07645 [Spirochaetes bacterium GWE1_32_154]OHD50821.1 MAG: hypothetical protein A2Y29_02695 [Spirochaetes bacterium GWE2_31_10]OHD52758.1 MAG: hypothetical protein A2015_06065 [Spirochaetes bacterium GWF1_31_7]HBD95435.1 hypothetical protein [Spirochaetia bacterium]HBI36301.1 hypothetical protein [Spirochaetia bacterium]
MEYFEIVFKAIEDIENNITEKINVDSISSVCCMSPFHFHRIFKSLTGYSIMAYVRKRKLHEACKELIQTNKKIIDISFEYNYESNEAFTRAVKKESGFNPCEIRKQKISNIGIDKMPAWGMRYKKLYGDETLKYEIITLENLLLAGITSPMTLEDDKNYDEIGKIVEKLHKIKNTIDFLKDLNINREFGIASESTLDLKNPYSNKFNYYRGYEIYKYTGFSKNVIIKKITNIQCAKFYVGSTFEDHKKALDYIYGVWLHETSLELNRDAFDFMEEIIESQGEENKIFFYIPVK